MKGFNAIQLVILFMSLPFLISWLDRAVFQFAGAAFWSAVIVYIVMCVFTVKAYYNQLDS